MIQQESAMSHYWVLLWFWCLGTAPGAEVTQRAHQTTHSRGRPIETNIHTFKTKYFILETLNVLLQLQIYYTRSMHH